MWKTITFFTLVLLNVSFLIATDESSNDELLSKYYNVMRECNETFKVNPASKASFKKSGEFPDDAGKPLKCYLHCMLMGMGVLSDDKFLITETAVIYTILNPDTEVKDIEEVATACAVRTETCKCDRAYEYLKCIKTSVLEKMRKS